MPAGRLISGQQTRFGGDQRLEESGSCDARGVVVETLEGMVGAA